MTPAKAVRSNPLTPLRKKQSSDHFALMLGDSVMINDGVLGAIPTYFAIGRWMISVRSKGTGL